MAPNLALLMAAFLAGYMFWRESREHPKVTRVVWIPTAWAMIIFGRTICQWLNLFGLPGGAGSDTDGSPLDAAIFFALIVAGAMVLRQRHVQFGEICRSNRWLIVFFAYCLISVVWSDSPFISFKRWIKVLGHPIMVLVLLTEPDPEESFSTMMKRCAYIFVPFSIVFIKYFPGWGRGFDPWSGMPSNLGMTTNKNTLGCICFLLGTFYVWYWLKLWAHERSRERNVELLFCTLALAGIAWLLHMAHSSTSGVSLAIATATMFFLGFRKVNMRYIGVYIVVGAGTFLVANWVFGLVDMIIAALGRNPTLTDRTVIWHEVLKIDINPLIGTGFEDFWTGERRERLTEMFFWSPNQAHNGYLETYLNLGYIGLGLMLALMVIAFCRGTQDLMARHDFGRFRVAYIIAFAFYNWTEAAFKALHPAWFIFFIIFMELPRPEHVTQEEDSAVVPDSENTGEMYTV